MTFFEKMTRTGTKIAKNVMAGVALLMSVAATSDKTSSAHKMPEQDMAKLENISLMARLVSEDYGDTYVFGSDKKLDSVVTTTAPGKNWLKAVRKIKGKKLSVRQMFRKKKKQGLCDAIVESAYQDIRKQMIIDTVMTKQFSSPLSTPISQLKINSDFGERHLMGSKFHYGTDLKAAANSAVFCPVDKAVVVSSCVYPSQNIGMVELDIGDGYHLLLLHVKALKAQQDTFYRGQQITTVMPHNYYGPERSTGPHLHFEIRKKNPATGKYEKHDAINTTEIIQNNGLLVDAVKSPLVQKVGSYVANQVQKDGVYKDFVETKNELQRDRKTARITRPQYRSRMRGFRTVQKTVEQQAYQTFAVQLNANRVDVTTALNTIDARKNFRTNHTVMTQVAPANQNSWSATSSFGARPLVYNVL